MTDLNKRMASRGPQIAQQLVISEEETEKSYLPPSEILGELTKQVVVKLIEAVGHDQKFLITIDALPREHPIAPGYMVRAKTRLK